MGTGNDMKPVAAPSVTFTYQDFLNFPNDGKRHEIIDGEHYVTPSPNTKHQVVSMNLTRVFILHLERHHSGACSPHRSTSCFPISAWSSRICSTFPASAPASSPTSTCAVPRISL